RDHAGDAAVVPGRARVGDDALLEALGLSDIEHLAAGADHAVDAGAARRELGVTRDHGAPGAERARRELRRIARLLGGLGQRRLVLLVIGKVELRLDVLLWVVHGLSEVVRRPGKGKRIMRRRAPAYSSTPVASAVRQARCWPPSTATVTPVTLVAPAR